MSSTVGSPYSKLRDLILTKCLTTFSFCIHWRMLLWTWGVWTFSNPSIFIPFLPQYGCLSIFYSAYRMWECCGFHIFMICRWRLKRFIGNSWLGKFMMNPICTNGESTPFVTVCSLPGRFWTIWVHSPGPECGDSALERQRLLNAVQSVVTTDRKLSLGETTKCYTQTLPTNLYSNQPSLQKALNS